MSAARRGVRPKRPWEFTSTKVCLSCQEPKAYASYYADKTDAEGYAVRWRARCGACWAVGRGRGPNDGWRRHSANGGRWLAIEPLREWLLGKARSYTMMELEEMCGTSERVLYRQMYENKYRVSLGVVDTILTNAGVGLWELYPDD